MRKKKEILRAIALMEEFPQRRQSSEETRRIILATLEWVVGKNRWIDELVDLCDFFSRRRDSD